jgi:uncharacterized membrane protein
MNALFQTPERQRLATVAMLLLWSVALLSLRLYYGMNGLAIALFWNLFLASLPLLWSSAFRSSTRQGYGVVAGIFFVLWLLFFPNAPYLLTDMIHLKPQPDVPQWFMLAMLLSCAGTGTLLGYYSLLDIHETIEEKWGKVNGWAVTVGSLMLSAFGIYLGRFLRWNSWEALTNPLGLLKSVAGQFINAHPHPHPVPVTLIFGIGLLIGYLALRSVMAPSVGRQQA